MKIKRLLILTALILTFCTTAFAEENKSSKYPNIWYLTTKMEQYLELADNGDHESTVIVAIDYYSKILSEQKNRAKAVFFIIEMLITAEAQGSKIATELLNMMAEEPTELGKLVIHFRGLTKNLNYSNTVKSIPKPVSTILENYTGKSIERYTGKGISNSNNTEGDYLLKILRKISFS